MYEFVHTFSGLRVYRYHISFYILHGRQQGFTLLCLHFCVAQFYNHFIHRPPTFYLIWSMLLGFWDLRKSTLTFSCKSKSNVPINRPTTVPPLVDHTKHTKHIPGLDQGTGILISILPCPTLWRCSSVEVISFSLGGIQVSPPTRASIQECPSSPRAKQHNVNNRQTRH